MRRAESKRPPRPIIFLGPSIPDTDEAREVLDADYRPPIRRGDLESIETGSIVGIVDGVFEQELSVSPREVHLASCRGVTIFGSSSMGALRAAEVRTVIPVGLIAEWYRNGTTTRDDEVALVFDPDTGRALSVPMVNVRYAVDRLVSSASLSRAAGDRIIDVGLRLPYQDRSYRNILQRAGVDDEDRLRDLAGVLQSFDLKREDAFALLEEIGRRDLLDLSTRARAASMDSASSAFVYPTTDLDRIRVANAYDENKPVTIWETGAEVRFDELLRFLKLTGRYEYYARAALARQALAGHPPVDDRSAIAGEALQAFYDRTAASWGWRAAAEQHVNLDSMGVGLEHLEEHISEELVAKELVFIGARENQEKLGRAIRAGMWIEPLRLKLEATRLHAFISLSKAAAHHCPSHSEVEEAKAKLMRCMNAWTWQAVVERCVSLGLAAADLDELSVELARARYTARVERQVSPPPPDLRKRLEDGLGGLELKSSPKVGPRFTTRPEEVMPIVDRLKALVGVTRVGFVGELTQFAGIHISQASRPDGTWSSSYGSGKGLTPEAAVIGGVMEETEKWAQEQATSSATTFYASYRELVEQGRSVVDPCHLPLPYDSCYTPELSIAWTSTTNLLTGAAIAMPAALMYKDHKRNMITYSKRVGCPVFGTNGLASGFSLEEALLHAICEYVERHADHADEIRFFAAAEGRNPSPRFVDPRSLDGNARTVADKLSAGGSVKLLDITSEVKIPSIHCVYVGSGDGHWHGQATHPDPEVACEMAMMEAAQSAAVCSAGGREDLTLRARSLGRHERTRPRLPVPSLHMWLDPDRIEVPVSELGGVRLGDVFAEVMWCLERLREAGVDTVAALDLTQPGMAPARAVRVVIPRLLSISPGSFGRRGLIRMLDDMVPQLAV